MRLNEFETFVDSVKKQGKEGELAPLLSDPIKLQALIEQSYQQLQKTMHFLAEFGALTLPIERLKRLMQEARAGHIPQERLTQSLQQLAGISSEELVDIYTVAYDLFLKKQFDRSAEVATFLVFLNPEIASFWRLLGSCYWNQNNPQEALAPFLYAVTKDATSIDNHTAALECLVKLGMTQEALNYYRIAKEILSDARRLDEIKRLDLLLAHL